MTVYPPNWQWCPVVSAIQGCQIIFVSVILRKGRLFCGQFNLGLIIFSSHMYPSRFKQFPTFVTMPQLFTTCVCFDTSIMPSARPVHAVSSWPVSTVGTVVTGSQTRGKKIHGKMLTLIEMEKTVVICTGFCKKITFVITVVWDYKNGINSLFLTHKKTCNISVTSIITSM